MRKITYVTFLMYGASSVTYLMWLVIRYVTYLHMRFVLYAQENLCYVPYAWGKLCYVPIVVGNKLCYIPTHNVRTLCVGKPILRSLCVGQAMLPAHCYCRSKDSMGDVKTHVKNSCHKSTHMVQMWSNMGCPKSDLK